MIDNYCPKCLLGHKVIRKGKYSKFIGCSRFPWCDYIGENIKNTKDDLESKADDILKSAGRKDLIL